MKFPDGLIKYRALPRDYILLIKKERMNVLALFLDIATGLSSCARWPKGARSYLPILRLFRRIAKWAEYASICSSIESDKNRFGTRYTIPKLSFILPLNLILGFSLRAKTQIEVNDCLHGKPIFNILNIKMSLKILKIKRMLKFITMNMITNF